MKRAWRAIKAWWKPLSGVTKGVIIVLFVLVGISSSVALDQGSEELAREAAATTTIVALPAGCQEAVDVMTNDLLEMLDSQDLDEVRSSQLGQDVGASCLSHSPLAMSPFIILLGDRKDVVSQGVLEGMCEGMENLEDKTGTRMTAEAGAVCDGVLADAPVVNDTVTQLEGDLIGVQYPSQGNVHLDYIGEPHAPYNSAPPSSGPHYGPLGPWGVSENPIPPELYIHNLEDAGVVFVYNCPSGCDAFAASLARYVEARPEPTLVMTPYDGAIQDPAGASHRAAAIAWGRVLYFDDVGPASGELDDFIRLYHGIDHHER